MKKRALGALALMACTACGGAGGGSVPAAAPAPAVHSKALFVLSIPAKSAASASRAPQYISPNTQSLTIAVNGAPPSVTANVTPGSSGCTTSGGATTCDISVPAPAGSDTFAVVLYAGLNATGSVLAGGTVSATVSQSSPSPVDVTLGGVVASVTIALGTSAPPAGSRITIPVSITAKDASGATIVAPGGFSAPLTLTDSDTSGHTALSTTTVSDPGTAVTLSYDGSPALTSATISAQTGGTVTSVTPAVLTPQLPSPTPSPTPVPALNVSPATLNFTAPNVTLGIVVSESGYTGVFSESDTCGGASPVATVSPTSASGPGATFTVKSAASGLCTVTISDTNGQSAKVTVNVTITQGIIQ